MLEPGDHHGCTAYRCHTIIECVPVTRSNYVVAHVSEREGGAEGQNRQEFTTLEGRFKRWKKKPKHHYERVDCQRDPSVYHAQRTEHPDGY